jgi:glycosyltransferase involved in cell wall biosynthesis
VHPAGDEVLDLLAAGDAGLVLERKVANTKVCLSVKFGEYLAAGLPVICTPAVEGTALLVRRYDCGLVVDPEGDDPPDRERGFLDRYPSLQLNGQRLVRELLSLERCAAVWQRVLREDGR